MSRPIRTGCASCHGIIVLLTFRKGYRHELLFIYRGCRVVDIRPGPVVGAIVGHPS